MQLLFPKVLRRDQSVEKGAFGLSVCSLFLIILSLVIPPQALGAALLESPGNDQVVLEQAVRPGNRHDLRDLLLPQQEPPLLEGLDTLRHVARRARPGDSLAKLFIQFGLSEQERQLWLRAIQKNHPIKGLRVGQEMNFYFTRPELSPRATKAKETLKALEIGLNEDWILTWEKGTKGIVFSKREKPYDVEIKTVGGVIESSLSEDGIRVGLNQNLLSQLADIFSWEIDLNKDIQKGDTFKLLYEQKSRKGKESKASFRVLAAELINAGQEFFAIYFEKEKGRGGYYDLNGRSLARAFLRFPLEFSSISSQFSHSRFHPILRVDRPHNGVDFTAKRGTPVRAVADGKILYAGWRKGGYGRMIEVQHDSVYATRYAHLQGLAPGIRRGMTVQKGQVIGYVGSTGRSTGAHLHFELYKDQVYVDALNFEYPPEDRIEPALRRVFDNAKQLFLTELAATPHS
ncbi:MAG: M23 family metallopeptidase [Deltaproteobacteria bacterium]|nr:M23 family metallopeptidase [Deltaproteobacteria bacterium]